MAYTFEMKIAFVGCGYVADYYIRTLPNYENLELVGVFDSNPETLTRFSEFYTVRAYKSLDELLNDDSVEIVVNLTNPRNHFEVSKASLESGKHVYSEKPLAVDLNEAKALMELAGNMKLVLSGAPCNLLGETAQTLWRALHDEAIGKIRLVYANLDDGMTPMTNYTEWRSDSGSPWPWRDEFEIGCAMEHAGYYLTWLVAFFGPASTISSTALSLLPDKGVGSPLEIISPDFSCSVIEFESGVVARLTSSIIAPDDWSLRIIGDNGVLSVDECRDFGAPVYVQSPISGKRRKKIRLVRKSRSEYTCGGKHNLDFSRGIAVMAEALKSGDRCPLPVDFVLHVNEIALAIQNPLSMGSPYHMTTYCETPAPLAWAQS